MKALTLYQPWASLIADRRKPTETRPRPWNYIGPVAIQAGQQIDRDACIRFGYNTDTIPRGVVVCVVWKYGCVRFPSPQAPPDDYGNYAAGRYGYLLKEAVKFPTPVPAKGSQGIWEWQVPVQYRSEVDAYINRMLIAPPLFSI